MLLAQDGRLFVTTKGRERFEIKNVVKDKPVLLCEVEVLQDDTQQDKSDEVGRVGWVAHGAGRAAARWAVHDPHTRMMMMMTTTGARAGPRGV